MIQSPSLPRIVSKATFGTDAPGLSKMTPGLPKSKPKSGTKTSPGTSRWYPPTLSLAGYTACGIACLTYISPLLLSSPNTPKLSQGRVREGVRPWIIPSPPRIGHPVIDAENNKIMVAFHLKHVPQKAEPPSERSSKVPRNDATFDTICVPKKNFS